jgi:hypothetical protein
MKEDVAKKKRKNEEAKAKGKFDATTMKTTKVEVEEKSTTKK